MKFFKNGVNEKLVGTSMDPEGSLLPQSPCDNNHLSDCELQMLDMAGDERKPVTLEGGSRSWPTYSNEMDTAGMNSGLSLLSFVVHSILTVTFGLQK